MLTDLCAAGIFAPAEENTLPSEDGEITTEFKNLPDLRFRRFAPWESGDCLPLSPWSQSAARRLFDIVCVLSALPLLAPLLLLVALAVWLTSGQPVVFQQKRVGRLGCPFTIFKFRTLETVPDKQSRGQRFTPLGRFLRQSKLDELPQLLNVLAGQMSLVGPRPKMREYQLGIPLCRPGITGAATLAFACEEQLLEQTVSLRSSATYRAVVMPAKHRLDSEYMARATFASDLQLILATLLRRWDQRSLQDAISILSQDENSGEAIRRPARLQGPGLPKMNRPAEASAALSS